ncbi:hypothetical protein [Streptomyces sp. NPDC057438]|uniref:hypothetical protein n=1 Tax=Streptomyces sp. NPDC057438 TaxID=3346133 RepID=UPI0036B14596
MTSSTATMTRSVQPRRQPAGTPRVMPTKAYTSTATATPTRVAVRFDGLVPQAALSAYAREARLRWLRRLLGE